MQRHLSALLCRFSSVSLTMFVAFALLVVAGITLDQTTKIHSQKSFMAFSHPSDVHQIESKRNHLFTLGVSPSVVNKSESVDKKSGLATTSNWLEMHLTYVRNTGAAWGAMSSLPKHIRTPFFTLVTIVALSVIGWLFYMSHPGQRLYRMGLCFILSGAIGNFIDRMALGYVIDWIQFHWKILGWEYRFPVFNVADIVINVGVMVIMIDLLANEVALRRMPKPEETAGPEYKKAA